MIQKTISKSKITPSQLKLASFRVQFFYRFFKKFFIFVKSERNIVFFSFNYLVWFT